MVVQSVCDTFSFLFESHSHRQSHHTCGTPLKISSGTEAGCRFHSLTNLSTHYFLSCKYCLEVWRLSVTSEHVLPKLPLEHTGKAVCTLKLRHITFYLSFICALLQKSQALVALHIYVLLLNCYFTIFIFSITWLARPYNALL